MAKIRSLPMFHTHTHSALSCFKTVYLLKMGRDNKYVSIFLFLSKKEKVLKKTVTSKWEWPIEKKFQFTIRAPSEVLIEKILPSPHVKHIRGLESPHFTHFTKRGL